MYQNIYVSWSRKRPLVHLWDDQKGYAMFPYNGYAYKKDRSGTKFSLFGDRVKKITYWDKDDTDDLFEADVHPERRTLIDMYYKSDDPSVGHKVVFFDIEVEIIEGFPSWKNPVNKILSFTIYDQISDTYYTGILDPEKKCTLKNYDNVEISIFTEEYDLLNYFLFLFQQLSPTIISGWNIDKFDIPYLFNRMCVVLGYDMATQLSPIGQVVYNKGKDLYRIAGISSLDYYRIYRLFSMGERPSYKLDDIGNFEVNLQKIKYDGTLVDLYQNDIDLFLKYNINDVRILKLLDEKLNYIDVAKSLAHKGHICYEDVYSTSYLLDGAILTYLKRKGIVAPSKKRVKYVPQLERDERIVGAYVKSPQVGLHKWVFDIDAASMYPNIMISLNISPETKIGNIQEWDPEQFLEAKKQTYIITDSRNKVIGSIPYEELKNRIENNKCSVSAHGTMYRTDKKGLIPSILEHWFEERLEFKNLRKKYYDQGNKELAHIFDIKQYVQKILLNSMYGAAALPVFRYYDTDNAMSVTKTGQAMIKYAEKAGNRYYKNKLGEEKDYCIYIDTDSLFFSALDLIKKDYPEVDINDYDKMTQTTLKVCDELQSFINKSLDIFANKFLYIDTHRFNFKQEVVAPNGIFISKKRYSLWIIDKEGMTVDELLVKGIDIVRSNFPESFRKLLSSIITKILKLGSKEQVDKTIIDFKTNIKKELIEDIAMSTGIKQIDKFVGVDNRPVKGTPAHAQSAIWYNMLLDKFNLTNKYTKIAGGDKIKWVYLKTNPYGMNKVAFKTVDNPPQIMSFIKKYIDVNKIFDKLALNKIDTFYSAMNWAPAVDDRYTLTRFF